MAESRPNVLVVNVDHWPGTLLGIAGHPAIQTPTLDQLARNGVRYTQAYSESPMCIPARRTLMTGTTPRTHGDRNFDEHLPMPPQLPTLAQTFRDAGYQAYAVGKTHVFPQRQRIGFDDVMLSEEGRLQHGPPDDYQLFLGDHGYAGQAFASGVSANAYIAIPWHLPEELHVTNWATQQMARTIKRRDPTRPAFWYLSYVHPHPPLAPLPWYLDMYQHIEPEMPVKGDWTRARLPWYLRDRQQLWAYLESDVAIRAALRGFYALCTHIDHQLRVVIGTLREEGLLANTILLFTSDHGDMLGNHGAWAKGMFYEGAAKIPMILVGTAGDTRVGHHRTDDRLVGLQDVMPTLLDLAGIAIPSTVDGLSMVGERRRDYLYGESWEGERATRMVRAGRYKLIYYATGNQFQLFDVQDDPRELHDLSESAAHADVRAALTETLSAELNGADRDWLRDGGLVGLPMRDFEPKPDRGLVAQRGIHWPPPRPGYA